MLLSSKLTSHLNARALPTVPSVGFQFRRAAGWRGYSCLLRRTQEQVGIPLNRPVRYGHPSSRDIQIWRLDKMNRTIAVFSLLEHALPVLNSILGFALPQKAKDVSNYGITKTNTSSGSSIVFQECSNFYVNIIPDRVNRTGVTALRTEVMPAGFVSNAPAATSTSAGTLQSNIDPVVNCLSGSHATSMSNTARYCPYQGQDGRCGL
jgi:hypothetical protein